MAEITTPKPVTITVTLGDRRDGRFEVLTPGVWLDGRVSRVELRLTVTPNPADSTDLKLEWELVDVETYANIGYIGSDWTEISIIPYPP